MIGLLEGETGAAGSGSGFAGRKVERPVLAYEVVAERVVLFFGDEAEPLGDIDLARRVQDVVRPERQLRIAGLPREADALAHQPSAEPEPARLRLDIEEPQLRDLVRLPDQEHRADGLALDLGDPAALAPSVEALDETGADLGDERLEAFVPAVFLVIEDGLTVDHPADVAGPVRAQHVARLSRRLGGEKILDA